MATRSRLGEMLRRVGLTELLAVLRSLDEVGAARAGRGVAGQGRGFAGSSEAAGAAGVVATPSERARVDGEVVEELWVSAHWAARSSILCAISTRACTA